MSDLYEGIVFRADEATARRAVGSLATGLRLRLVGLTGEVFGIYRVASWDDVFDEPGIELVAGRVSAAVGGVAVALFFDGISCSRRGKLYDEGRWVRDFGDEDAWWVPYGADGELLRDGPRHRESELDPDVEYDCICNALDAALMVAGFAPEVSSLLVLDAFCSEGSAILLDTVDPNLQ